MAKGGKIGLHQEEQLVNLLCLFVTFGKSVCWFEPFLRVVRAAVPVSKGGNVCVPTSALTGHTPHLLQQYLLLIN